MLGSQTEDRISRRTSLRRNVFDFLEASLELKDRGLGPLDAELQLVLLLLSIILLLLNTMFQYLHRLHKYNLNCSVPLHVLVLQRM